MATKKLSKKKLAEIKKKRSEAAKKGWETRRRNTAKKRASNNQRKLVNADKALKKSPKKKKANSRISLEDKSRQELEEIVRKQQAELNAKEAKIRRLMLTENWVDAVDPEYISRDGHITLRASMARHDPDYWDMRERLDLAYAEGEDAFDNECWDIAAEYGYEVREVYTLFFSP
jgi:hypothetical protein